MNEIQTNIIHLWMNEIQTNIIHLWMNKIQTNISIYKQWQH